MLRALGTLLHAQLDGFVISRAAAKHSVNYRSVVVFGVAEVVE